MKTNKHLREILSLILFAFACVYIGISFVKIHSMKNDWKTTKSENTISSYTLFINKYPYSFLYTISNILTPQK